MKIIILIALLLTSLNLFAASSKDERANLNYQATIQAGYDYKSATAQFMFSKFLNADEMVGLKIGEGGASDEDNDDYNEYQFSAALQYKKFTGNSFYFAPEIYYMNYSEEDKDDTSWINWGNERVSALGIGVRIGNQWQWKNFTIGCDWIGIGRNMIHWTRSEDFFSNKTTVTLMNLYLGWSF